METTKNFGFGMRENNDPFNIEDNEHNWANLDQMLTTGRHPKTDPKDVSPSNDKNSEINYYDANGLPVGMRRDPVIISDNFDGVLDIDNIGSEYDEHYYFTTTLKKGSFVGHTPLIYSGIQYTHLYTSHTGSTSRSYDLTQYWETRNGVYVRSRTGLDGVIWTEWQLINPRSFMTDTFKTIWPNSMTWLGITPGVRVTNNEVSITYSGPVDSNYTMTGGDDRIAEIDSSIIPIPSSVFSSTMVNRSENMGFNPSVFVRTLSGPDDGVPEVVINSPSKYILKKGNYIDFCITYPTMDTTKYAWDTGGYIHDMNNEHRIPVENKTSTIQGADYSTHEGIEYVTYATNSGSGGKRRVVVAKTDNRHLPKESKVFSTEGPTGDMGFLGHANQIVLIDVDDTRYLLAAASMKATANPVISIFSAPIKGGTIKPINDVILEIPSEYPLLNNSISNLFTTTTGKLGMFTKSSNGTNSFYEIEIPNETSNSVAVTWKKYLKDPYPREEGVRQAVSMYEVPGAPERFISILSPYRSPIYNYVYETTVNNSSVIPFFNAYSGSMEIESVHYFPKEHLYTGIVNALTPNGYRGLFVQFKRPTQPRGYMPNA